MLARSILFKAPIRLLELTLLKHSNGMALDMASTWSTLVLSGMLEPKLAANDLLIVLLLSAKAAAINRLSLAENAPSWLGLNKFISSMFF